MDEYQESNHEGHEHSSVPGGSQRWLVVAVVALLCIAVVAFAYGYRQQALVHQLSTESSTANASVGQLQSQVTALTAKLNDMTAAQTAAQSSQQPGSSATAEQPASASVQPGDAHAGSKTAHTNRPAKRRAPADTKYTQLQAQLADQQKQLKATQEEVEKNRADLEGSLNSTRDDLNGSIARTHEELVALQKRGERSYFEFDLNKSKQFSRVGPLTLSLRKADTKHKNYNLAMIVDDDQLQKKNVNLFEPIWIHTENESQPVQIVVNKIGKDFVHGYVSAPKYKPSELNTSAPAAGAGATVTPISAKPPAGDPTTPNPQPPQQPQDPPQPELR